MVAFGRSQDFLRRAIEQALRGDHVGVLESVALVRGCCPESPKSGHRARQNRTLPDSGESAEGELA